MANKLTYKKGDKVWVQVPIGDGKSEKRLAQILSIVHSAAYFNNEVQITVHYLQLQGVAAYQCIPQSWIVASAE